MAVIDQISTYDGNSWSSPYDIGANAENIALTNTIGRNLGNSNNVSSALQYISGRIIGQNSALAPWVLNSFDAQNNNEKILINNNGVIGLGSSTINDFVTINEINEINAAIGKTDTDPVTYENLVTNKMKAHDALLKAVKITKDGTTDVENQVTTLQGLETDNPYIVTNYPFKTIQTAAFQVSSPDGTHHNWANMSPRDQSIRMAFVSVVVSGNNSSSGIFLYRDQITKIFYNETAAERGINTATNKTPWLANISFIGINAHTQANMIFPTIRVGNPDAYNLYWQTSSAVNGNLRINGLLLMSEKSIIIEQNRVQDNLSKDTD